jgi:hypothetical protein
MLDNLRETASQSPMFQDEQPSPPTESAPRPRRKSGTFLGMTAAQRFVIALILFMMVCVMGAFCLLITEKVVLPF